MYAYIATPSRTPSKYILKNNKKINEIKNRKSKVNRENKKLRQQFTRQTFALTATLTREFVTSIESGFTFSNWR